MLWLAPNTCWPTWTASKKQAVVSHSSAESEVTAVDVALRIEAISVLHLLQHIQGLYEHRAHISEATKQEHIPPRASSSDTPTQPFREMSTTVIDTICSAQRVGKPVHGADIGNIQMIVLESLGSIIEALEHVCSTHRISLVWIRDRLEWKESRTQYLSTDRQLADMSTKPSSL